MGCFGSDAVIEAADVVIMNDDLLKVAETVTTARQTMSIVRQNILFSFSLFIKVIVLAFGAAGLAGICPAVFADVGVTVLVILNAMRTLSPISSHTYRIIKRGKKHTPFHLALIS